MNHDIDIKKLQTNCYRQSKVPGEFMLQLRVTGGVIPVKYLKIAEVIAEKWGDGNFHMGSRMTLDFPGIKYEDIPTVNAYLKEYIEGVETDLCNVDMHTIAGQPAEYNPDTDGFPTIGSRNISACIGNTHCICGNINTQETARALEKLIYPSNYHIKLNVAGCPNDCIKAHMADFGIISVARMVYDAERCIGCCVGCGECVRACPSGAWRCQPQKFYRVIIGGRTGRQTPRAGKIFLNWANWEVICGVIGNWQKFSAMALDNKPVYLHGGHLIDRVGYEKFKQIILDGVKLNPECLVAEHVYWHETEYRSNINVKKPEHHQTVYL